jgi:hypothetical protein
LLSARLIDPPQNPNVRKIEKKKKSFLPLFSLTFKQLFLDKSNTLGMRKLNRSLKYNGKGKYLISMLALAYGKMAMELDAIEWFHNISQMTVPGLILMSRQGRQKERQKTIGQPPTSAVSIPKTNTASSLASGE